MIVWFLSLSCDSSRQNSLYRLQATFFQFSLLIMAQATFENFIELKRRNKVYKCHATKYAMKMVHVTLYLIHIGRQR